MRCGEQLDDLRGMEGASATRCAYAVRALVERLERVGRRILHLDRHVAARRYVEAQRPFADQSIFISKASLYLDELDPEPSRPRREALDEDSDLVRSQLDHRPRVQDDAVPHQAPVQRSSRLEAADRLQHRHQHPFELRQGHDMTPFVADGSQVTDLGQREQPLVLRVRPRDSVEHVDVLRRGKPVQRELAQARQP